MDNIAAIESLRTFAMSHGEMQFAHLCTAALAGKEWAVERLAPALAGRPRTTTIRGTPAPAHLPADSDDADTIVVDPPSICELLAAFVDGELDGVVAQTFRDHLAGCSACERDLLWQMQLSAALSTKRPR